MDFSHLTSAARDVLGQLFVSGPTWDGNISSKSGRDELIEDGLARRIEGWAFLTSHGIKMATSDETIAAVKLHADKRWYNKARCI